MFYHRLKFTPILLLALTLFMGQSVIANSIKLVQIDNQSQVITVTTTTDEDNGFLGGGNGISLREALTHADAGSIIILPKGRFVFDDRFSTLLITRDLLLKGSGIGKTIIDGNENAGVLHIATGVEFGLSDLTITGGSALKGGAIRNAGTLQMYAVVLSGNRAEDGGALYNEGHAELRSCIVRDNHAGYFGGGIHNNGGRMLITDAALLRNTAEKGGGMYNQFGFVVIRDGTIFGNLAGSGGGVADYIGLTEISNTSASDNYGGNFEGQVLTLGDNFDSDGTSKFRNGFSGDTVHPAAETAAGLAYSIRDGARN